MLMSTTDERVRYSDKELEEFKILIQDKLDQAIRDYDLLKEAYVNGMAS